jgi:hypothetical protein
MGIVFLVFLDTTSSFVRKHQGDKEKNAPEEKNEARQGEDAVPVPQGRKQEQGSAQEEQDPTCEVVPGLPLSAWHQIT